MPLPRRLLWLAAVVAVIGFVALCFTLFASFVRSAAESYAAYRAATGDPLWLVAYRSLTPGDSTNDSRESGQTSDGPAANRQDAGREPDVPAGDVGIAYTIRAQRGDSPWPLAQRGESRNQDVRESDSLSSDSLPERQGIQATAEADPPAAEQPVSTPKPEPKPAPSRVSTLPPPPGPGLTAERAAQPVNPEELPVYRVQPGDTLWVVAKKLGTTALALTETNRLHSDVLSPGQPLYVPPGKTAVGVQGPYGTKKQGCGELLAWPWARWVFNIGSVAIVTDLQTGKKFKVYCMGGANHADCEPLTASDTAVMYELFGRRWSWATRPVLLTVGSRTFAASINGQPHGPETIFDNNFKGQFCLYFYNSRSHNKNAVNPDHQANVLRAAGWQ